MGGAMPSTDEIPTSSVAKETTRELPNKGAMSQGTSVLPKDKGHNHTTDPVKAVVTKRQHNDIPSSPGYHNVYVRRKVESEHNKVNASQEQKGNGRDKTKEQEPSLRDVQQDEVHKPQAQEQEPSLQDVQLDEVNKPQTQEQEPSLQDAQHDEVNKPQAKGQEPSLQDAQHDEVNKPQAKEQDVSLQDVQHDEVNKPQAQEKEVSLQDIQHDEVNKTQAQVASPVNKSVEVELAPPVTSEKTNVETVPEKTELPAASATDIQDDAEQLSIQYWSERFNRLQTYLENCDRSTQEGYLRKLRSLSAAGRSMHAIELEKRAIHLLVEEAKELQRMKSLNVLGKVSPNASSPNVASKQSPLQRQFQK